MVRPRRRDGNHFQGAKGRLMRQGLTTVSMRARVTISTYWWFLLVSAPLVLALATATARGLQQADRKLKYRERSLC